jgi:hypothetical protein
MKPAPITLISKHSTKVGSQLPLRTVSAFLDCTSRAKANDGAPNYLDSPKDRHFNLVAQNGDFKKASERPFLLTERLITLTCLLET